MDNKEGIVKTVVIIGDVDFTKLKQCVRELGGEISEVIEGNAIREVMLNEHRGEFVFECPKCGYTIPVPRDGEYLCPICGTRASVKPKTITHPTRGEAKRG